MGNIIRAEVSENNPYWIEKHRYYELKHFCLQYPTWKRNYVSLDGLSSHSANYVAVIANSTVCDGMLMKSIILVLLIMRQRSEMKNLNSGRSTSRLKIDISRLVLLEQSFCYH